MDPFLIYLRELQQDKSIDDTSATFRFLLPAWSAEWAGSPASYDNAFAAISRRVESLEDVPLRRTMLRRLNELIVTRVPRSYSVEA